MRKRLGNWSCRSLRKNVESSCVNRVQQEIGKRSCSLGWVLFALLFPLFQASAAPPQFSVPGGIYTNEITLQLSANPPGVAIHVTLDGSEPTATSTVYTAAITIRKSMLVRARSFERGAPAGEIVSQTYRMADADLSELSSNLPLVVINTFGQNLSHDGRVPVSMRFIDRDKGARTRLIGTVGFDSRAIINIRGTSSLQFPKHSFTFRTKDEQGNTLKAPLLGFPSDSEWVLYAPYPDKSLIRDVLAYDLSRQMGHYAPRTRFVEVFLSDSRRRLSRRDYVGVYVFEEKIKQGDARVNIAKLGPEQNKEPEISGGYIFKKDHNLCSRMKLRQSHSRVAQCSRRPPSDSVQQRCLECSKRRSIYLQ